MAECAKCEECGSACNDSCDDSCGGSCSHVHVKQKGGLKMEDLDEETKRDIVEYQNLQQQIQVMLMQRQQALGAIAELDQAKTEVEKTAADGALYRFVGSVIIPKKKDELLKNLKDERDALESRRDVFAKQEERLRKRFDELQRKLQAKLGGGSNAGPSDSKPAGGNKIKPKKPMGEGAVLTG